MPSTNAFGRGSLNKKIDEQELLNSIGLDKDEIAWRKQHIDFSEDDVRRLVDLESLFLDNADEIADRFYENLTPHDRTMSVLERSPKTVEQLKQTQRAYLVTLAAGEYDEEYFRNRARIGKLHELLDMPLNFYIGQYGVYYNLLFELLDERMQEQVVDAIRTWTAEQLADRDHPSVGDRLLGALRGNDADYDEEAEELAAALEQTVREEIHDGVQDLLAVLRVLNLDMQVAVDTYVNSYSGRLEDAISRHQQLAREVQRDVHEPLEDVNEAADEVAHTAQAISRLADESSDEIWEMADELSNVSAATEEIASTADNIHEQARRAYRRTEESRADADQALAAMGTVEDAAGEAATDIQDLEIVLEEFVDAVDTVDDIATRTRHLGRQATLESTKSGGSSEKFADLADEVKEFADETEQELAAVTEQVESLQSAVTSTVQSVKRALVEVENGATHVEAAMDDIDEAAAAIEAVTGGIEDVAEATDEQATSVEQAAVTANQTATVAEQVAAETDDIAAATEEQKAQVEAVARNVRRLTDGE